jgi:hypothetical protein
MKNFKLFGLILICLVVLLASCALPGRNLGAAQTLPNNAADDRLRTQAVATVYAGMTAQAGRAATEAPTSVPSATPLLPTATLNPSPTSTTPVPQVTATWPDYPTRTATPAQTDYTCAVEEIEPEPGETVKVEADFDLAVRVKNTGEKGWDPGKIMLVYTSGEKMQTKTNATVLTSQVDVDGSTVFTVDMHAPAAPGTYKTTWALMSGRLYFCPVHIQVVVVK